MKIQKKLMKRLSMFAIGFFIMIFGFVACKHHHQDPEKWIENGIERISKKLDLDDTQQTQLRALKAELLPLIKEMRKEHDTMKAEMHDLLKQDRIDAIQVKQMVGERRAKLDVIIDLLIDRLTEFHAELSPEQKEKLVEIIDDHQDGEGHRCRLFN